jgi:hypothetical protein
MKSFLLSAFLITMTITELTGSFDVGSTSSGSELSDYSLGSFSQDGDHSRLPASSVQKSQLSDHITELTGTFK